jgi:hypothetical protein
LFCFLGCLTIPMFEFKHIITFILHPGGIRSHDRNSRLAGLGRLPTYIRTYVHSYVLT